MAVLALIDARSRAKSIKGHIRYKRLLGWIYGGDSILFYEDRVYAPYVSIVRPQKAACIVRAVFAEGDEETLDIQLQQNLSYGFYEEMSFKIVKPE